MIVPIVISTDENYLVPSYVMLHSLLNYANNSDKYRVFVLVEKFFSAESQKLLDSLKDEFTNVEINFINMQDAFCESTMQLKYTTIPSMYRLLIPQLLTDYDKCIYLDVDIIICGDISTLYTVNIGDNYLAAVRDIEAGKYINIFEYEGTKPQAEKYVNSGVLLMNLEKLREDNVVSQFMDYSKSKLLFMDQDIINIVCEDKIVYLPLKYNALVKYRFLNYSVKSYLPDVSKYFGVDDIHEAIDIPVAVHYAQPCKPWSNKYIYQGYLWHRYVSNNIDKNIYFAYIAPFINEKRVNKKVLFKSWLKYRLQNTYLYIILLGVMKKI